MNGLLYLSLRLTVIEETRSLSNPPTANYEKSNSDFRFIKSYKKSYVILRMSSIGINIFHQSTLFFHIFANNFKIVRWVIVVVVVISTTRWVIPITIVIRHFEFNVDRNWGDSLFKAVTISVVTISVVTITVVGSISVSTVTSASAISWCLLRLFYNIFSISINPQSVGVWNLKLYNLKNSKMAGIWSFWHLEKWIFDNFRGFLRWIYLQKWLLLTMIYDQTKN